MAGGAAAALAIGSGAWYNHQFGRPAHAMTPAEEGYGLICAERRLIDGTDGITVFTQLHTRGSTSSGTRPTITKPSDVVSRFTARSAPRATLFSGSHTDPWSDPFSQPTKRKHWPKRMNMIPSLTTKEKSRSDRESCLTTFHRPTRTMKPPALPTTELCHRI